MVDAHGIVPGSITTPNSVDSKAGRLQFTDGYPTAESALKIRDEMQFVHGVMAP
jgi:hypothetical protein